MALKPRYIPASPYEDVKFGKFFPAEALPWSVGAIILGVVLSLVLKVHPVFRIILGFLPLIGVVLCFAFDLPGWMQRRTNLLLVTKNCSSFEELFNISNFDSESCINDNKDNTKSIIMSYYKIPTWEVITDLEKDRRADHYAQDILEVISNGADVSIHGTCTGEILQSLEQRSLNLPNLPDSLRELENARIDKHYKIAKNAETTRYYIKITAKDGETALDCSEVFEHSAKILSGPAAKEVALKQLTPNAKKKRGKF
ncbi:MAG: hypothetical protein BWY74_00028 [Firmicutes bacterium ADurb.Bin419]|nr:MAG: hypothetical protein BWY74_00028 [Firmicutes bacterium ADurb.Bin419]